MQILQVSRRDLPVEKSLDFQRYPCETILMIIYARKPKTNYLIV